MISDLGALINWTREVFALEFTLYGFSFSTRNTPETSTTPTRTVRR